MLYKYGKRTLVFWSVFIFNRTVFTLGLVGYEIFVSGK